MVTARLLVISPVRNEAAHIERVARAVAAQELLPAAWVVVDDGSTDDTVEILRALQAELPFLTIVERSNTAGRRPARRCVRRRERSMPALRTRPPPASPTS